MNDRERTTAVYGIATLTMVALFWPYFRIVDENKSIIMHLLFRTPFILLGDMHFHLDQVEINFVDDFFAIALNPAFVSGAIIGRLLVKDWPSTLKALFPTGIASAVIFVLGFSLSRLSHGRGDMAGLWVIAPLATVAFLPFALLGAVAGWKGGEYYDRQKGI